jgi:uncharacterized protein (TIGR02646 family)
MKPISKGNRIGNHALITAHATPPITAVSATSRWRGLINKSDLCDHYLLPEQYHLCCYSELDADREGLGFHIEHIENKSQNPARTFDYANLSASAFSSEEGVPLAKAQGWEVFGGHTAGKQGKPVPVDTSRFVSPLQPDCARFFAYLSSGEVEPHIDLEERTPDWDRADYTIRLLNLNSPYLVSLRRQWWDELDALFREHLARGWSSSHLAQVDLVPTGQRLNRFFSLTRTFYGPLAARVLQQHAPHLA